MTSRKNRYFDREDQFRSIILSNDIDNESVEIEYLNNLYEKSLHEIKKINKLQKF